MLKELIDWYLRSLDAGGYPLIVLLMAIESSIVPLPSELVIPRPPSWPTKRAPSATWAS